MSVIVTGCAGFIAARVTELLLDEGLKVIGVDSINDAYDVRMKEHRIEKLKNREGFTFFQLDICDTEKLFEALIGENDSNKHGATVVMHLAARAGVRYSVENPWVYIRTNVEGTVNMLEVTKRLGIKKFILASTSSLYGGCTPPFKEDTVTETPFSPYAASKKGAEAMCHSYHHLFGIDMSLLRFFTVYGPAGRPDMAPFRFIKWISEGTPLTIFGDGSQSRDFTYVDDIARGVLAARKMVGYEAFNLGSDQPIGLMDAIKVMEKEIGKEASLKHVERHAADPLRTWAVIDKAREVLGWSPEVSFEEGVRRAVQWYQENREWAKLVDS
eukprot:TRINITY_DN4342_c0_g1_i2.p2 TRINITY_DN4342_c0_g1~~TRINITY_DN4342_c0_g1_i2.p2  ORF type:complete len:328 (+),score=137.86 TRINITY_DN4342_c0_g1_i2:84-1067(+)